MCLQLARVAFCNVAIEEIVLRYPSSNGSLAAGQNAAQPGVICDLQAFGGLAASNRGLLCVASGCAHHQLCQGLLARPVCAASPSQWHALVALLAWPSVGSPRPSALVPAQAAL